MLRRDREIRKRDLRALVGLALHFAGQELEGAAVPEELVTSPPIQAQGAVTARAMASNSPTSGDVRACKASMGEALKLSRLAEQSAHSVHHRQRQCTGEHPHGESGDRIHPPGVAQMLLHGMVQCMPFMHQDATAN